MAAAEVLGLLARANVAAAAAIVLVVALRKVARPRFGARLVYGLWLLPLLAAAAVVAPARVVTVTAQAALTDAAVLDGLTEAKLPAAAAGPALDLPMLILALWLAGVVAAAVVMVLLQRRFTAEVRKGAIGPAVVGVIAPRIVTPADFDLKFSGEEQALVLAHERAHIERQDSRVNGLSAAIQCLCWFNPLVHLAAHLMRIDQEMACDETVVTRFPEARRAYAQALVKAQLAIRPLPLGCYWPSGTEHPLVERIAMLKGNDLSHRRRLAGGAALAALCAATGCAAWASQSPQVRIAASAPAAAVPAPAPTPTPTGPTPEARQIGAAPAATPAKAATPDPLADAEAAPATEAAAAPEASAVRVAALDPPREGQAAPPGPTSPPGLTEAQRGTLRNYLQCQRAATKALDDGRSSEDAIATQVEERCEAKYQAYRQAWIESPGAGAPGERGWTLDNSRQERARVAVHAARRAQAMMAGINDCVRTVADQLGAEPFERVVDQAVLRCGALVPFPVAPIPFRPASTASDATTGERPQAPDANHEKAIRMAITLQLQQIAKARSPQPQ